MKGLLIFAASLAAFTGYSQDQVLEKLITAFETGNVSQIESEMMSEIDLTIEEFEDFSSKSESAKKLRSFFRANSPKNFIISHEGNNKANGIYRIGTLETSAGTYRVTFFLEKTGGEFKISKIKIE